MFIIERRSLLDSVLWALFPFLTQTLKIADVACGLVCMRPPHPRDMLDVSDVRKPALSLKAVVLGVSLALPWMLPPFLLIVHDIPAPMPTPM